MKEITYAYVTYAYVRHAYVTYVYLTKPYNTIDTYYFILKYILAQGQKLRQFSILTSSAHFFTIVTTPNPIKLRNYSYNGFH